MIKNNVTIEIKNKGNFSFYCILGILSTSGTLVTLKYNFL